MTSNKKGKMARIEILKISKKEIIGDNRTLAVRSTDLRSLLTPD